MKTEYRPEHYRFAREQSRYSPPLDRAPNLKTWAADILAGLFLVAFFIAVFVVLQVSFYTPDTAPIDLQAIAASHITND